MRGGWLRAGTVRGSLPGSRCGARKAAHPSAGRAHAGCGTGISAGTRPARRAPSAQPEAVEDSEGESEEQLGPVRGAFDRRFAGGKKDRLGQLGQPGEIATGGLGRFRRRRQAIGTGTLPRRQVRRSGGRGGRSRRGRGRTAAAVAGLLALRGDRGHSPSRPKQTAPPVRQRQQQAASQRQGLRKWSHAHSSGLRFVDYIPPSTPHATLPFCGLACPLRVGACRSTWHPFLVAGSFNSRGTPGSPREVPWRKCRRG
jgi:hypothetical protein